MDIPMITAHSGCEGTDIDTMDSIEKALIFGADVVEIDVRMDPSGDLRISHDPLSSEGYDQKNLLEDVLQRILPTSVLINFDIKEEEVLYKTLSTAHDFGFPAERLIFTGSTTPEQLINDPELTERANFFLNLEEVLKYAFIHRKGEFGREVFFMLMENPYIFFMNKRASIPDVILSESIRINQKIFAVSKTFREKIYKDTVRIYQETRAAAANLPRFLLWDSVLDDLKAGNVPLSVWTVNEPDLIRRCMDLGVCNITTQNVQLAKQILFSRGILGQWGRFPVFRSRK